MKQEQIKKPPAPPSSDEEKDLMFFDVPELDNGPLSKAKKALKDAEHNLTKMIKRKRRATQDYDSDDHCDC